MVDEPGNIRAAGEQTTLENLIRPDFSQSVREVAKPSEKKEMLSIERDGSQTLVRINSSSLSLIQTCPRKSKYILHDGWQAKSGSTALTYGKAIHKALEVFYTLPREARVIPSDFDDAAMLVVHGFDPAVSHPIYNVVRAFVSEGESLRMLPDTDKRSLSSGIWTLGHYFKTYANDVYEIYSDENGPVTERRFELVLRETADLRIILFGTIDLVFKNSFTGSILPGDHKTSSQMGLDFLNRIKPNHQYTGYVMGVQRVLGLPTEDFLINGIQVKPRPLTARGGPPTFTRQITRRTESDFAEFADAVEWAVRSYLNWQELNKWPLGNVDACSQWGGCGFLDVCAAPNELRQNILESKYER